MTTVSREELAIEVMNVRRRIHGLDDLDLATLRRIKRDAGINEAFAIADALLARLAATPADSGVREATIEECARAAESPGGYVQCDDPEMSNRIAEWRRMERAAIVARIRALSTKAQP